MNFDPEPYDLGGAVAHWLAVCGVGALVLLVLALLLSIRFWKTGGVATMGARLIDGVIDLVKVSPRRTMALAWLTWTEAIRRKALYVGVVFVLLFMFAGWFLSDTNERASLQVKVHVSFVLTAITWLSVPVVLLLSCWGLPEDIRLRSLHTVVTKPVRRSEVILGRILGFSAVATALIAVMGGVGYVWIERQTSPEVELFSRVPVYGQISFYDREGQPAEAGVNTGDLLEYRSYVEGQTKARAVWDFEGVVLDEENPELIFETRFQSFRTHKGDMDRQLLGRMILRNDATGLRVPLPPFEVAEFSHNLHTVDNEIEYRDDETGEAKTANLVSDLIPDGTLTVELQCLDPGQYIGMAKSDMFIRLPDRPFASGYFKAILGIWLMLVLIVTLGVTLSSIVKGPVATMATFAVIVMGRGFREFLHEMVTGQVRGGGPFEAWYRLINHMNETTELPGGSLTAALQVIDKGFLKLLWLVDNTIPNFGVFRMTPYVANGFDVPWSAALLPSIVIAVAYILPCVVIGYYCLALRELEAK